MHACRQSHCFYSLCNLCQHFFFLLQKIKKQHYYYWHSFLTQDIPHISHSVSTMNLLSDFEWCLDCPVTVWYVQALNPGLELRSVQTIVSTYPRKWNISMMTSKLLLTFLVLPLVSSYIGRWRSTIDCHIFHHIFPWKLYVNNMAQLLQITDC